MNGIQVPGCTSVSGLFQDDGWKFGWPVKVMYEELIGPVKAGIKIDEVFLREAKNAWRYVRNSAADTGTTAHRHVEEWVKYGIMPPTKASPEILNCIAGFFEFVGEYNPEWLGCEMQVGSAEYQFAGILDLIARVPGLGVTLIDIKTSKEIKAEYRIQLAGLALALMEQGVALDARAILHLPKSGAFELRLIESDLAKDQAKFLSGLQFLRAKNLFLAEAEHQKKEAA